MPFHTHSHSRSHSGHIQPPHQNSIAQGLQTASQALGSVGAPTGINLNSRVPSQASTSTSHGTDAVSYNQLHNQDQSQFLNQSHPQLQQQHLQHPAQLQAHSALHSNPPPLTSNNSFPQYQGPRRMNTIGHGAEQNQLTSSPRGAYHPQHQRQLSGLVPSNFDPNANPNLSAQSTPGISAPALQSGFQDNHVPSSLQAGQSVPGWSQGDSTVPTLTQIQTNAQQYSLPTRSNTMSQSSHSYSRSSPAGLVDQRYVPFSSNPTDAQQRAPPQTPQNQKYYIPPTPTNMQSPLALDHIRPRANSSMNDDQMGGSLMFDYDNRTPTNSNYLAPWPVFAFDWCKYPVTQGDSAGKMAIGSYLEDPHNFVRVLMPSLIKSKTNYFRSKLWTRK